MFEQESASSRLNLLHALLHGSGYSSRFQFLLEFICSSHVFRVVSSSLLWFVWDITSQDQMFLFSRARTSGAAYLKIILLEQRTN